MKKAFIFFLILAFFAGTIFYIGYGARKVKPGEFGVLVSKTSGIDEKPIMNGDKDWHWQFILPTNTKIEKFTIEPVNLTKTVSGELPSGSVYTSLFNTDGNFNYKFTFSMSVTITPENVIQLMKKNIISDNDNLNDYLSMVADSIVQLASDYYLNKAYKDPAFRPESVRRSEITRSTDIVEEYPFVDLSVFALTECVLPDFSLYKELQKQGIIVVKDLNVDVRNKISEDNTSISDSKDSVEKNNNGDAI